MCSCNHHQGALRKRCILIYFPTLNLNTTVSELEEGPLNRQNWEFFKIFSDFQMSTGNRVNKERKCCIFITEGYLIAVPYLEGNQGGKYKTKAQTVPNFYICYFHVHWLRGEVGDIDHENLRNVTSCQIQRNLSHQFNSWFRSDQ